MHCYYPFRDLPSAVFLMAYAVGTAARALSAVLSQRF